MIKLASRAALLASATSVFALAATPAFAQDNSNNDTLAEPAQGIEPQAAGEVIVVTGSRIQNPNLEQSSPVAVVTEDEIELRAANNVEEFLREVPGITPNIGAQVNNGNGGATYIDLRGIGATRNLTLLNGTRVVPSDLIGRTNVDVIPVALLQRVDVLTGGAGAAYGADAISGVVNFITKDDFSGMDLTVSNGITEQGDGHTFRADLTMGANFDDGRGNATFSIGYTDRDAVFQGDREFGQFNLSSFTGNPGGSSTTVPTVITVPGTNSGTLQVAPDGNSLIPFYDAFNFNPFNLFQLPQEQFRFYGTANYEVADGIELFGEGLFTQSTTSTIIAPAGTFRNVLTTPLSNPFLPSGIRNQICGLDTDSNAAGVQPLFSAAECNAAALATDPDDPAYRTVDLDFGRRFVELGTRNNEYKTQLFQLKAGFRADVFSNISFEAFGAYGESENQSTQSGNGTLTRLQQSLLSTSPTACLDTSNGCAPINLFGPIGTLDPTGNLAAFLDVGNTSGERATLAQAQAFFSGDFGYALPGAVTPISVVVGGEFREYNAETFSDLLTRTPGEVLGNGAASPPVMAGYNVYEAFGELAVPIIEDSFIPELTLLLGGRVSDYSTTGTEYTWKVGGTATLFDGFQLRGNFQRVTRAPNIFELFNPQVTGLDNFDSDPCTGSGPVNDATLRAVCLAQGAPASSIGAIIVDPAGQVNTTFGGNPNLGAEEADTWTIGAVFTPYFAPGLAITVDYFNIDLSGAITTPTIDSVFAQCFGADFRDNPQVTAASATDPRCTQIRRNPATGNLFGSVATTPGIPTVFSNLGRIKTDGIDLKINYQTDLGFADLALNFAGTWTNSNTFDADATDDTNVIFECAGFFGSNCGSIVPEFQFSQRTTLGFNGVDLSLLWRYIDGVDLERSVFDASGNAPFLDEFETIGSEHYFDFTARFQAMENLGITVAAINLLNNKPKIVGSNIGSTAYNSGNVYPSTYDPLGRRFNVTAKITF